MNQESLLEQVILFKGLSQEELRLVESVGKVRRYEKNEVIFNEGTQALYLYALMEGRVKIFKVSFDGKEQILHMVEAGEPFGEVPVFEGGVYPAYAMTTMPSIVFSMGRDDFMKLIRQYPEMSFHIIGFLCKRLRQFTKLVEDLSLKEVPGRLATYLINLYYNKNRSLRFELDINKNMLAAILGTVPETLSRAFFRLKALGVIDVDGSVITIKDLNGLEEIAVVGR